MAEIEQYKELCSDGRLLDRVLWLIPTVAFTISLLILRTLPEITDLQHRIVMAIISTMIHSAFILQFIKYCAYQHENQQAILKFTKEYESLGFVEVTQYSGLRKVPLGANIFVQKLSHLSSATYMTWIMIGVLILEIGIVGLTIVEVLTS